MVDLSRDFRETSEEESLDNGINPADLANGEESENISTDKKLIFAFAGLIVGIVLLVGSVKFGFIGDKTSPDDQAVVTAEEQVFNKTYQLKKGVPINIVTPVGAQNVHIAPTVSCDVYNQDMQKLWTSVPGKNVNRGTSFDHLHLVYVPKGDGRLIHSYKF